MRCMVLWGGLLRCSFSTCILFSSPQTWNSVTSVWEHPEWVGVACLPILFLLLGAHLCLRRQSADSQRLFSSRVHLIPVPFLCTSAPGFWNWVTWGRGWTLPNLTTRYIISTLQWFYVSRRAAVFTGDSSRRPHSAVVIFLVWAVGNLPVAVRSWKTSLKYRLTRTNQQ